MKVEYNEKRNTITQVYEMDQFEFAPLAVWNAYKDKSASKVKAVDRWFKDRGIPSWRKDLDALLANLHIHTSEELLNKAFGLSLSDQYWLNPCDEELCWSAINFFEHEFKYAVFFLIPTQSGSLEKANFRTPNNTTDGMLPKCWILENGKRVLVKQTYNTSRQEPVNEWLASQVCHRLGFDHCEYWLDVVENRIVSKCECFITPMQELISAYDIFHSKKKSNDVNDFNHYVTTLEEHGIAGARESLENMLVVDFLMMNTDRHMKNFGIIRNVETLEWEKCIPIFDTGQSMACDQIAIMMNFNDGVGKYFTNGNKKFSAFLDPIQDFQRFNLGKLSGIEKEYEAVLRKYADYTEMSEQRIEKLVAGLKMRVGLFERKVMRNQ